jgi:hypothetical protein
LGFQWLRQNILILPAQRLRIFAISVKLLQFTTNIKVKVKCNLVQALRLCTGRTVHRASRDIALPFLDHGTRSGWEVSVTPRPLFTPGKNRYPLYRRLGGPQGRSGQVRKISPPPGFDPWIVQPVASRYTDYATGPTTSNVLASFSYMGDGTLEFLYREIHELLNWFGLA